MTIKWEYYNNVIHILLAVGLPRFPGPSCFSYLLMSNIAALKFRRFYRSHVYSTLQKGCVAQYTNFRQEE